MLKKSDCNFNKQFTDNNKVINNKVIIVNKDNYIFKWSKKEAGRYVFIQIFI